MTHLKMYLLFVLSVVFTFIASAQPEIQMVFVEGGSLESDGYGFRLVLPVNP